MKSLLFSISLFLAVLATQAQGEYNNWCFGQGNTLNFNGTPASISSNSLKIADLGNTTISDKQGNLLFYTQTDTVWDASHNVMQNGTGILSGNILQSVNILPVPCNDSLYYIFSISHSVTSTGRNLYYSIVNINQNNGLGAVVQKNILLDSNVAIGFAMTRHGNNKDYWISYHKVNTNTLCARVVSSTGISSSVLSQIGPSKGTGSYWSTLEFSPDGTNMISTSNETNNKFIVNYSFDLSTGVYSNSFQLSIPASSVGLLATSIIYSQFSPDQTKLYVSGYYRLYQFDYNSGQPTIIANSGQIVYEDPWPLPQGEQSATLIDLALGPDSVIYISRGYRNRIGKITQPNLLGTACNYIDAGILTSAPTGAGLPTIIPNLALNREIVVADSLLCQYDSTALSIADTTFLDSVRWRVEHLATGVIDSNKQVSPTFVFNEYGLRAIESIVFSGCSVDTARDTILIHPSPIANLGNDTILCEGENMQLQFNDTSFNYLWSTSATTMNIAVLQADTYWVAISSVCGTASDTVVVDSLIPALVHLPNDTLLCLGDSLELDATVASGVYQWSTGGSAAFDTVTQAGLYHVTATNFCGTDSDTIQVDYTRTPLVNLGNDPVLCTGDTLFLDASDTLSTYFWNNGDTSALDTVIQTGMYWAEATNICGVVSDTVQVWFVQSPVADVGNDTVICIGDTLALSDTAQFGTYAWTGGSTSDSLFVQQAGVYALTVTNACGATSDTIVVQTDTIPVVHLGNDTLICELDSIVLDGSFSRATYLWQDGSTDSSFTADIEGTYWVETSNLCGVASDTFNLAVDSVLNVDLGADTVLCPGQSSTLQSNVAGDYYYWNTGSFADGIVVQTQDEYWLAVSNVCGTFRDTIQVYYDQSPLTELGPDGVYCLTDLITLNASWSRATYLWNDGSTDSTLVASQSNQYWVQVVNLCGYDDDTVNIQYHVPLNINLGTDTSICNGDSILLVANGNNATYVWNTGNSDSTQWALSGNSYSITATNVCGTVTDQITVKTIFPPEVNFPNSDTLCEGEVFVANVQSTNSNDILWSDGNTNWNRTITQAGVYDARMLNQCGVYRDSISVGFEAFPTPTLGNDTVICNGEELELSISAAVGSSILWSTGETSESIIVNTDDTYEVFVTTPHGCEGNDAIIVESCGTSVFIPTAFTPNGDGLNDEFIVKGTNIEEFYLAVYDRWGKLVFETNNHTQGWNGKHQNQGEFVNGGTYTYLIKYKTDGLLLHSKTGVVQVVR